MTEKSPVSMRLVLTNGGGLGRIVVDMEAFFDFSFCLAEKLEDLRASQPRKRTARGPLARRRIRRPSGP